MLMEHTRDTVRGVARRGLLRVAALFVAPFVTPGFVQPSVASECLDRPAGQITVTAPGSYTGTFTGSPPGDFHVYDMRGATFAANPPLNPVTIEKRLNGACVVGVRVVGRQSRNLTWDQMKNSYDGDGVRFVNRSGGTAGRVIAEGIWIDNVEDGLEPVRYSGAAGKGYTWTLRSSYFRYIRDDVVENDACHAGEVVDVLVDNSRNLMSTRPSSGKRLSTGAMAPVIKVYDSAIHVGAANEASAGGGSGRIWKWPSSSSSCTPAPVVDVRNTVFRVDLNHSGAMGFPPGRYQNVKLVWLGGGAYPVPVPSGVTVTSDVNVWNNARNAWLGRHGCDAKGDVCKNLTAPAGGSNTAPKAPPPPSGQTISLAPSLDTYLRQPNPTSVQGSATIVKVDSSSSGGAFQGLVYFDLAGRIPANSTVSSATLTLETKDGGNGAKFHQMLVPWNETSTWSSTGSGIQADGVEADNLPDFSTGAVQNGSASFDVTPTVQAWVDGAPNHGWALLPLGSNGWGFYSREGSVPPRLSIVFEPCNATGAACTASATASAAPASAPPPPPSGTRTVSFAPDLDTYLRAASPMVAEGARTTVDVDG
jgi:hypothetical protein